MQIKTYLDDEDFIAETLTEFDRVINVIVEKHKNSPILIELTDSKFGAALVGFGFGYATIEIFTPMKDKHIRAMATEGCDFPSIEFTFAGELTEVLSPLLIRSHVGHKAIRTWFMSGDLDADVSWMIEGHADKKSASNSP